MHTRIAVVLVALCFCAAAGCASGPVGPPPPVLLEAFDARTNKPLAGVDVIRWEFEFRHPNESVFPVPLGPTDADGRMLSNGFYWEPTFMLHKPGYGSAEVRTEYTRAYVASPSDGNRWYRKVHGGRLPPTWYEEVVPAGPVIRVPMWPRGS